MSADTETRSMGDVPSTSAAPIRAEADEILSASKRLHFTYGRHVGSPTVAHKEPPRLSAFGTTPLVNPAAVPDILRAVLLEDGCVKVNFRDNTVVRLDPTGTAFTVTTPEGETLRQLSEFAVTRFLGKVRSALEFRNAHADVPFFPASIAALPSGAGGGSSSCQKDLRFRASVRVQFASWSCDAKDAEQDGFLTRLESGACALESIDGIARVVLSAHGLVARVTYPLLYAAKDLDERASPAKAKETSKKDDPNEDPPTRRVAHDYVWHTQTFSADACPGRWRFPVALLTQAVFAETDVSEQSGDKENAAGEWWNTTPTAARPEKEKLKLNPTTRAGSVTTLPVSLSFGSGRSQNSGGLSHGLWVHEGDEHERFWWSSCSVVGFPDARGGGKANPRRPVVEFAPGQTIFVVRRGTARSKSGLIGTHDEAPAGGNWVEVVSVLAMDDDALVTADAGRFVVHVPDEKNGARSAKMYDAKNLPDRVAPAGRLGSVFEAAEAGREFAQSFAGSSGTAEATDNRYVFPNPNPKTVCPYKTDTFSTRLSLPGHRVPIGRFAERCFATRAAADVVGLDQTSKRTDLSRNVSFGRSVTTNSNAYAWGQHDQHDPDPWSVLNADVVEETSCEGTGEFVAFKDGRARVKFTDRTLLTLRRDHQACRLLLPDGELVEVRCANPMAWSAYVTAATEFGRWAFLSPESREAAAAEDRARDARVAAELDGIRRFRVIDSGVVPCGTSSETSSVNGTYVPGTSSVPGTSVPATSVPATPWNPPSTPDRPKAQPSAPTTPQSEHASPLRAARGASPLTVSVPVSPLDGSRIRRQESLEKLKQAWEADSAAAPPLARNRALFRDDGSERARGARSDSGDGGSVAAVAAAAAGVSLHDSPPASVTEALEATERWLQGVKDELSPGATVTQETRVDAGAGNRMAKVAQALDANEKWLSAELEEKAKNVTLDFSQPPDF
jgi:hypothetical protein